MAVHTCHAKGCDVAVPPRLLMCGRHWRMVPAELQADVWATYRRGQERTKDPSPEYLEAARMAIAAVAHQEELAAAIERHVRQENTASGARS